MSLCKHLLVLLASCDQQLTGLHVIVTYSVYFKMIVIKLTYYKIVHSIFVNFAQHFVYV